MKIFFTLISALIVFAFAQWCASEGYTLAKGLDWVRRQAEDQKWVEWEKYTSLGSIAGTTATGFAGQAPLGSLWQRSETVAPNQGIRQVPAAPPAKAARKLARQASREVSAEVSKKAEKLEQLPVTKRAPVDEEGLSPTDREALIGLLK